MRQSIAASLSIFTRRHTPVVVPMLLKETTRSIDEGTVARRVKEAEKKQQKQQETKKITVAPRITTAAVKPSTAITMTCSEAATIPPPKSPESATGGAAKRRILYAASRAATVGGIASTASTPSPSAPNAPPKRRGGIASAASFASRRVAAIVSSLERSFDERKTDVDVKKDDKMGQPREKRRYGGAATATRFLHGIAEREQALAKKEQEAAEEKRKEEERRSETEMLAKAVRRGRSALSAVNGRRLEPVLEGVQVEAIPETKLKKAKKYTGAATTGRIGEILMGRKQEEKEEKEEEKPRHLVGFTHRRSHLSLSSQLSGSASFYLIGHRGRGVAPGGGGHYGDSTLGSESVLSDEDDRGSMSTDLTSVSRQHEKLMARRRKAQRTYRRPSRASSFSSITESSMSLHVETVSLNMDTVNFLGISIVGQSSARGDNGIYVANVMKGGAVALDGRIEQGDMILQVNEVAFDNFTNDQAVDVLREAVERKGTIRLTVAKSIDSQQRSCFTVPRQAAYNTRDEPVRPIDTGAWIQHTNAMRGAMPSILEGSEGAPTPLPGERLMHHQGQARPATSSSATSTGSNGQNTVVGGGSGGLPGTMPPMPRLDVHTDKRRVVEVMTRTGSGLDIKNRTWLKISIPMSFLGSDLIDWLLEHVSGLRERKDAKKYAADLLAQRLIAHVVNKITFTEQCYYVLGEQCADFARYRTMHPEETGVNGGVAPSWQWGAGGARGGVPGRPGGPGMVPIGGSMVSGYASMPMSPHPFAGPGGQGAPRHFGGEGSQISSTDGSGSSDALKRSKRPVVLPQPPAAGAARHGEVPLDGALSRQSFRIAMDNPYEMNEFFVDNL